MKTIKEYREEIQRAFDSQGTWGDRWKQWETILRQYGEDVKAECVNAGFAFMIESGFTASDRRKFVEHINQVVKIE